MHTPVEVTEKVLRDVLRTQAVCLISLGGGSTTGLGKALALRTDLPQVGDSNDLRGIRSHTILGQTEQGRKTTLRTAKVLPERSSTMLTSRSACLRISLSSPD